MKGNIVLISLQPMLHSIQRSITEKGIERVRIQHHKAFDIIYYIAL